jgi:hypothetical protein
MRAGNFRLHRLTFKSLFWVLSLLITGCAVYATQEFSDLYGDPERQDRWVEASSVEGRFYHDKVEPVLESRCVACHACYDAPCQLKLTAPEGIDRGINKEPVYNGTRLLAAEPSRLFIDAQSTTEWRAKGFNPVLNERRHTQLGNLNASLMFRAISLRRQQAESDAKVLPNSYDFRLYRDQQCPTIETYNQFSQQYPGWGMPYGLPNLSKDEYNTLTQWLQRGALMPKPEPLSAGLQQQVKVWEQRLNASDNKTRLAARYIYEHIYLYSLYLGADQNTRFKLVRSRTAPGQAVDRIADRRPYDDPGVEHPYYRLVEERESRVAKTHIPLTLNESRWLQWKSWLLDADYQVETLPGYAEEEASNPFKTFHAIPANSRYRFLLEHAQETIMAFIKGPVCHGQVAVNVINEQFRVYFVNPYLAYGEVASKFLESQVQHLDLPGKSSSNTLPISSWLEFSEQQKAYLKAKSGFISQELANSRIQLNEELVWDGEGSNHNAVLTVMRHFDNATVVQGELGNDPKTAWLIDYPLLERIHYLLVAGFDVYGNVGHQLVTRLYMDFLRMEGEMNFLLLLPKEQREDIRRYWYRNASSDIKEYIFSDLIHLDADTSIQYQTDDQQHELYQILSKRLEPVLNRTHDLASSSLDHNSQQALLPLANARGANLQYLPEVALLLVTQNGKPHELLTLVHNRGHANISSLFGEEDALLPDEDNITLARGVIGDYPNVLMQADRADLPQLVEQITRMQSANDYSALLDRFGVRRTSPAFWWVSDQIATLNRQQFPMDSGILDYNRLENR